MKMIKYRFSQTNKAFVGKMLPQLPKELLIKIFCFLPLRDAVILAAMCKICSSCFSQSNEVWKSFYKTLSDDYEKIQEEKNVVWKEKVRER